MSLGDSIQMIRMTRGGLLFDYEKGPVLDLPPGVRWPSGPAEHNKKHQEWVN